MAAVVESAPFKLTAEFVDLMDGPSSACFKEFCEVRRLPLYHFCLSCSRIGLLFRVLLVH